MTFVTSTCKVSFKQAANLLEQDLQKTFNDVQISQSLIQSTNNKNRLAKIDYE